MPRRRPGAQHAIRSSPERIALAWENLVVALTAAVIAVGLLCLGDLLLTFGVIRRLRQHTELLGNRGAERARSPGDLHARCSVPATFSAQTTEGQRARTGPPGSGWRRSSPPPARSARKRVPTFADYVRGQSRRAAPTVLAVVLTEVDPILCPIIDRLAEVASVMRAVVRRRTGDGLRRARVPSVLRAGRGRDGSGGQL